MRDGQRKLNNRVLRILLTLPLLLSGMSARSVAVAAEPNANASAGTTLYAGAGAFLDPSTNADKLLEATLWDVRKADVSGNSAEEAPATGADSAETGTSGTAKDSDAQETSTFVMADIDEVMNVRAEPSASSEKIGVLYKDCGGTILEQTDGWTKLQSGNLVGWASNDYLVFGKEAEALAADVGMLRATITTDSLRVRKEPNTDAGVLGLVKTGDSFEVLQDDDGSGFVLIDYDGKDGYVSADYVEVTFHIDNGETLQEIREREEAERQAKLKAKLTANQGAVQTSEDEVRLLAALIQCEAGNQPYEGQLAVGAVVMNRVRSAAYPNSVVGVVYASGQFSPAGSGHVADAYNGSIKETCLNAARAAIAGQTNVGGALHFRRAGSHEGTVIGGHVFW